MVVGMIPYIESIEKLVSLLSDDSKCIEDDTCLERILTQIEQLVKDNARENDGSTNHWDGLKDKCSDVLSSPAQYSNSSICFFMKMLNILVTHPAGQEDDEKDDQYCKVISNCCCDKGSWFSPQVQFAWLWCLSNIVHDQTTLVIEALSVPMLITLTKSPSMFVSRAATNFTGELLACAVLHSNCESQQFVMFLDAMKQSFDQLTLKEVTRIISAAFKENYKSGFKIFTHYLNLSERYNDEIGYQKMAEASQNKEIWISEFIQNLYLFCSREKNPSEILPIETSLHMTFSFLTTHPDIIHGYHMLSAVWKCRESYNSETIEICKEALLMPLYKICKDEYKLEKTNKNLVLFNDAIDKAMLIRSTMEKSLCHLLSIVEINKKFYTENGLYEMSLKMLKMILSHKESVNVNAVSCLHYNWKIAKSLITTLKSCLNSQTGNHKEFSSQILNIFKESEIDYKLLSMCGNILVEMLFVSNENEKDNMEEIESFCSVLHKRINDMRWNMKDTALELITLMMNKALPYNSPTTDKFLLRDDFMKEVLQCFKDDNSYIRASAFKLLSSALECSKAANILLDRSMELCMNTISNDREAMPRRAAVHLLNRWLQMNGSTEIKVIKEVGDIKLDQVKPFKDSIPDTSSPRHICELIMYCLFWDLDWEVRRSTLAILKRWKDKIDDEKISCKVEEKIEKLVELSCQDYDESVRKEAQELFDHKSDNEHTTAHLELKDLLESAIAYLDRDTIESFSHHAPDNSDITNNNDVILDCY